MLSQDFHSRLRNLAYCLLLSSFLACGESSPTTLFTALPAGETGIDFRNTLRESPEFNVLNYGYFYNGGGVAVGDLNNDGLADIYFTGNMKASELYLNKGNLKFEEVAAQAGVEAAGLWNTGVTMADVNNDGWLDIYVCRSAATLPLRRKNLLFINNRDTTLLSNGLRGVSFTEMSEEFGLDDTGYSTQAAFFDYDRDGDLDMYLLNHSTQEYAGFTRLSAGYKNRTNPDFGDKLYENRLIPAENESFGRFLDVTAKAGIKSNVLGFGLGIAIEDLNGDHWPDIYVSNDYNEEDYYYINQRDGTFREAIRDHFDHTSLFSMGSDVADINNDGRPEVYTLDMLPEDNYRLKMTSGSDNFEKKQALYESGFHYQSMRNMLHLNNGDGSFSEIGQMAGVSNTDWSWAALFADFDLDGWKDLFVSNGYKSDYTNMDFMAFAADQQVKTQQSGQAVSVSDLLAEIPAIVLPNYIYQNVGDSAAVRDGLNGATFIDRTVDWGLDQASLSNGAAYADLDNDGDLDLIVNNVNETVSIYRNNAERLRNNHYLRVRLADAPLNRFGIGAKVTLRIGDRELYQSLMPTRGYQSAVEPVLTFGLGAVERVDQMTVVWPNGKQQTLSNISADQLLTVTYAPEGDAVPATPGSEGKLFNSIDGGALAWQHQENSYNDFKRQPLLPYMHSSQGPGMAIGDINGDGLTDLYLGGARDQPGQLLIQQRDGSFRTADSNPFAADAGREDVDALFFDADGDGDMDLYVVSGGSEYEEEDPALQDRLYLNDGRGNLSGAAANLPAMLVSTSCVRAADVDGDGDQDLFVGGRLIPGKYPLAPRSFVLINDGSGRFTDQTDAIAPELLQPGMVTDAVWTDFNGDQQADLIVVGEWMPVRFFANAGGRLEPTDMLAGAASEGLWNTITAADLDQDGDIDYVLGNFGYNAQFGASPAEPLELLAKDFDNNGTIDPVMAYYLQGQRVPVPPKDDLIGQMPGLKKNFVFYRDYAQATIETVFDAEALADAQRLQATTLASAFLENTGDGRMTLHALPATAQLSPVYAILCRDFDQDGRMDILLGGNLTETRVQFGRFDAGKGTLLLGDGAGKFRVAPNAETGLLIRGSLRELGLLETADGRRLLLAAKNNDKLQVIAIND